MHFTIPVSDLAASRAFHTEVLRLNLVRHSDEHQMAFLTAGKDYVVLAKSDTPGCASLRPRYEPATTLPVPTSAPCRPDMQHFAGTP